MPSLVTDELVMKLNNKMFYDGYFMITEMSQHLPQISLSLVHEYV